MWRRLTYSSSKVRHRSKMYVLGNIHTYSYNYKTKLFVLVLSLISITGSLTLIGELYIINV